MSTIHNTYIGRILVEKRESDYIAMIENRKTQWGCGRSHREAIGDLVMGHFMGTKLTRED